MAADPSLPRLPRLHYCRLTPCAPSPTTTTSTATGLHSTPSKPLTQLLERLYEVPGLLACLREALQKAGVVVDATPVGWLALTLAKQVKQASQLHLRREGAKGRGEGQRRVLP